MREFSMLTSGKTVSSREGFPRSYRRNLGLVDYNRAFGFLAPPIADLLGYPFYVQILSGHVGRSRIRFWSHQVAYVSSLSLEEQPALIKENFSLAYPTGELETSCAIFFTQVNLQVLLDYWRDGSNPISTAKTCVRNFEQFVGDFSIKE